MKNYEITKLKIWTNSESDTDLQWFVLVIWIVPTF